MNGSSWRRSGAGAAAFREWLCVGEPPGRGGGKIPGRRGLSDRARRSGAPPEA